MNRWTTLLPFHLNNPVPTLLLLLTAAVLLAPGCGSSITVHEIDGEEWFKKENRSALDGEKPSARTMRFLRWEALDEDFETSPVVAMKTLHQRLLDSGKRKYAFHLAELAFLEAERNDPEEPRTKMLYLSCAEYAYAFLFDPKLTPDPSVYDLEFRWACDLYNRAIAQRVGQIFETDAIERGFIPQPTLSGELSVGPGELQLDWLPWEFDAFLPVYNFEVTGMPAQSLSFGIGAPYLAVKTPPFKEARKLNERFLDDTELAFPTTIFIRFSGSILDLRKDGTVRKAVWNLYDPLDRISVLVEGGEVPLETDMTTPLAYMLSKGTQVSGIKAMIYTDAYEDKAALTMLQPYDPDRIPVLFVHGLMSSPLTWISLFNDLLSDEILRKRYQFWFFQYPTGNPVSYSAAILRKWLKEVAETYDPDGRNPRFQDMVICGHSMGGLLTNRMVHDSGDRLLKIATDTPFDELDLPPGPRELFREVLFFERLPFVTRVVFMATPHRGSDLATSFIGCLGNSLIALPDEVDEAMDAARIALAKDPRVKVANIELLLNTDTGVSDLDPDDPGLLEVASWSFPPDLPVHCIMGNHEEAGVPGGTDTVVPYWSSHLDGVDSELIVKSDHGVHRRPAAIREVRRILHLHLEAFDAKHKKGDRP